MSDLSPAQPASSAITSRRIALLALVLNLFAILAVNFWIYYARATFIEIATYYTEPPTVSRAISEPSIGEPFAIWVSLSGLLLVVGVGILVLRIIQHIRSLPAPSRYLRICAYLLLPLLAVMQASSSVGMYMLSVYRFPFAHDLHMAGSYQFFLSQMMVIVLFTIFNHALLRDRASLAELHSRRNLHQSAVVLRYAMGWVCIAIVFSYFALFFFKDVYVYEVWPALHLWYTLFELAVISSFLLLLGLVHIDMFRRDD